MSIRKLTQEQFADGTVIDTEKVEQAITDTFSILNNMDGSIDTSGMVQKQIVWGATPPRFDIPTPASTYQSPWLPAPYTVTTGQAEERIKSYDPYGVSITPLSVGTNVATAFQWQMAFWTEDPILVTDMDVFMHVDQVPNLSTNYPYGPSPYEWIWNSNSPSPLINGNFVEDVVVTLTIDSPYNQQVASETSIALHKNNFSFNAQIFNQYNNWETADMEPSIINVAYTQGIWIEAKEVNCPIPAKSRVRVSIVIPNWSNKPTNSSPWRWNDCEKPWSLVKWSNTLTYLERKA